MGKKDEMQVDMQAFANNFDYCWFLRSSSISTNTTQKCCVCFWHFDFQTSAFQSLVSYLHSPTDGAFFIPCAKHCKSVNVLPKPFYFHKYIQVVLMHNSNSEWKWNWSFIKTSKIWFHVEIKHQSQVWVRFCLFVFAFSFFFFVSGDLTFQNSSTSNLFNKLPMAKKPHGREQLSAAGDSLASQQRTLASVTRWLQHQIVCLKCNRLEGDYSNVII